MSSPLRKADRADLDWEVEAALAWHDEDPRATIVTLLLEKPAAGGGAAGFPKRTEQRLGGGMPLFPQTSLGGGVGRLKYEALREETHCFIIHRCRSLPTLFAAMQQCNRVRLRITGIALQCCCWRATDARAILADVRGSNVGLFTTANAYDFDHLRADPPWRSHLGLLHARSRSGLNRRSVFPLIHYAIF